MTISRRCFLGFGRTAQETRAPTGSGASFLEDFYAARPRASQPALVYQPTVLMFDHDPDAAVGERAGVPTAASVPAQGAEQEGTEGDA